MNRKFLSLVRSTIFIALILSLMSAYTLSPPARNGFLQNYGIRIYQALAATPGDDSYTTNEDTPWVESAPGVLVNDTPVDPVTSIDVVTPPISGVLTGPATDGSFTYDPNGDFESLAAGDSTSDSFTYTVTDFSGTSGPATVTININGVNDSPVITEGASTDVNMDEDGSPTAFGLTLNATDADSSTLTWSISSQAANGTASASGDGSSKAIGYTPNPNYTGADSFIVQVSDGIGGTDTITVNVSIAEVNSSPVITEGESVNVNMDEDGSPDPFSLTLNATDEENDTLTWSISSQATNGTATASGDGTSKAIGYTPNLNHNGADSFIVEVSDGNGGTDTITVNVTIDAQNDLPVITEGASTIVNMDEDGSPTPFILTLNATDVDGNTLTWSISSPATNGTASASGIGASKVIGYSPDPNYNGPDSFVVHVADGNGGTDTITVNVTIVAQNDSPVITQGATTIVNMSEDGSPTPFGLTLNATDVDGDTLTWSISFPSSHGTATASGNGTSKVIGYTSSINYNGDDSFIVQVSDGNGGSDTITVNVNIAAQNDSPTNIDLSFSSVAENASVGTTVGTFSTTDPDAGSTFIYALAIGDGDIDNGLFLIDGNILKTDEIFDYETQDSYSIRVQTSDGGFSITEIFIITVIDLNDAPVGLSDPYEVNLGATLTVPAPGVLSNDVDQDGDAITAVKLTDPAHGTLALQTNGSFTYTPTGAFSGEDTFTYQVKDAGNLTSPAIQVIINVKDASSPSVVWLEPVGDGGQVDVNGEVIQLKVGATDDVSVDYVRFYRWDPNVSPKGEFIDIAIDENSPFEVLLNTSILNYKFNEIRARAYDESGNVSFYKWIWLYRVPPTNYLYVPIAAGE